MAPVVLLLSTADTELLAARASGAVYRTANPARVEPDEACRRCSTASTSSCSGCSAAAGPGPRALDALLASGLPASCCSAGRPHPTPS